MWYLVAAEAVVLAVLWGAWQHKKLMLSTTQAALLNTATVLSKERADYGAAIARYEVQLAELRKELAALYEAQDANATPASVAADLNRLFTR